MCACERDLNCWQTLMSTVVRHVAWTRTVAAAAAAAASVVARVFEQFPAFGAENVVSVISLHSRK